MSSRTSADRRRVDLGDRPDHRVKIHVRGHVDRLARFDVWVVLARLAQHRDLGGQAAHLLLGEVRDVEDRDDVSSWRVPGRNSDSRNEEILPRQK